VIVRENMIALGVLLFFLFFGRPLLNFLGIQGPELEIAGGVVIFLISLKMIFPSRGGIMGEDEFAGEPFVVPLAIPLIAGPSAIAVVMLFTSARPDPISMPDATGAVMLAWAASLATLLLGHQLARLLGRRGVVATERLMGMVLCVIAVHILLTGLESYFLTIFPPAR
jgi:multiple antibiotic resistance protein